MAYVEVNDHQFWVQDSQTAGEAVMLLHGGFGDGGDFEDNLRSLSSEFRTVAPDRRGHGRSADNSGALSQHEMARDTIALIGALGLGPAKVVGYSDGAVIALLVALTRPDLVERLVLISGVSHPDGWLMTPDHDSVEDMPAEMLDRYRDLSPDGVDHFPVVAHKIADLAAEPLGIDEARLRQVNVRTLVMAADDDIVHAEHTLALYRNLTNAELAIVPGTSHDLLHDKSQLVTQLVREFLTSRPVETAIPIRRAGRSAQ